MALRSESLSVAFASGLFLIAVPSLLMLSASPPVAVSTEPPNVLLRKLLEACEVLTKQRNLRVRFVNEALPLLQYVDLADDGFLSVVSRLERAAFALLLDLLQAEGDRARHRLLAGRGHGVGIGFPKRTQLFGSLDVRGGAAGNWPRRETVKRVGIRAIRLPRHPRRTSHAIRGTAL
jgi:hypothetical protein